MAEYIANAVQTVTANQNVLFSDVAICGNCSIMHRPGSGLIGLRGVTNQCRARYRVFFNGNVAIPTGGTVGAISLAISVDGEPIESSTMIETPAAVNTYSNIASAIFLDVPKNCCIQISVKNTSAEDILVQNANLIVERVA